MSRSPSRSAPPPAAQPREGAATSLLGETQRRLVEYYRLPRMPLVGEFVRPSSADGRERLRVREAAGVLEMALELPVGALSLPAVALDRRRHAELDRLCQLVEGVSHFVLLADRAQRDCSTTELELELQAELDKYLLLAVAPTRPLARAERRALRSRLFWQVRFNHSSQTIRGQRYRLAHRLAWRLTRRFERRYLQEARHAELRCELQRLYRVGQGDKIAAAMAA